MYIILYWFQKISQNLVKRRNKCQSVIQTCSSTNQTWSRRLKSGSLVFLHFFSCSLSPPSLSLPFLSQALSLSLCGNQFTRNVHREAILSSNTAISRPCSNLGNLMRGIIICGRLRELLAAHISVARIENDLPPSWFYLKLYCGHYNGIRKIARYEFRCFLLWVVSLESTEKFKPFATNWKRVYEIKLLMRDW